MRSDLPELHPSDGYTLDRPLSPRPIVVLGAGGIVRDAKVTLTNVETGVSVVRTTNADGTYEFANVRPGIYLTSAEKEGFSIALVENVQVQVAARLRVDLQMAVGQVTEKVQVTAAAPLVDTDTSQRSQVITCLLYTSPSPRDTR